MESDILQDTLSFCMQRWQLSNMRPLVHGIATNNYVAVAYSNIYEHEVVLKVLRHDTHEIQILELLAGQGSVKMLACDHEKKAMVLEYLQPGISLKEFFPARDDEATAVAAEVVKKLQEKDLMDHAAAFKTIEQWLALLDTYKPVQIPKILLFKARNLSKKLLELKQRQYVLHGDLHHENIVQGEHGWVAIDPQGVVGPLEYEVGRFLMNPIPDLFEHPDALKIVQRRIQQFSSLFRFDQKRLLEWVFVQAVLSACWTEQDGLPIFFNYFLKYAKMIEENL